MTKHLNITGLVIFAVAIITLGANAYASDSSVRYSLNNNERASLMLEEDKTLPTYVILKEAADPSDYGVTEEFHERFYTNASVRDTLGVNEDKALAYEEDRTIRTHELIAWKSSTDAGGNLPEAYRQPFEPGSIRANLSESEKAALLKEEDRTIR